MIQIDPSKTGSPLRKPWQKLITVGRAYELLREDLLDHLRSAQADIGWEYCRFHGLFHDDMNVAVRDDHGALRFQWHQVDKVFDALLAMGLRPFVELNPMPAALARSETTMFFYKMNVTPPKVWEEWEQLVEALAAHCADRYGLDEVRKWYFEVWNEPNFPCFWDGTKEEYFELYRQSALAVKRVDPKLRIGGPATAQAAWVHEFIDYCVNYKVPVDFVSTHSYPQDEPVFYPDLKDSPHAPGEFFRNCFEKVKAEVAASARPDLEIHWTEWNALSAASGKEVAWTENPHIDTSYAGSFAVKQCIELDALCDGMGWWVVSDIFEEAGMPHAPFSSTYGLQTIHGLPKASYHAFHFLAKLRGERIELATDSLPSGCGIVAVKERDTIRLLAWNHPALNAESMCTWSETIKLPPLETVTSLHTAQVGPSAGSGWKAWQRMGAPHDLSPFEMETLKAASQPTYRSRQIAADQLAKFDLELEPYGFIYAEYHPSGQTAFGKGSRKKASDAAKIEGQLSGQ